MSYRKLWPADRVARFDALQASAKHLGIRLKVERYGHAPAQMFRIVATDQAGTTTRLYDISEAEAWLAALPAQLPEPMPGSDLLAAATSMSAFKSKTLALIEALHLSDEAVVALGISLGVSHGIACGMDRATLGNILNSYVDAGEAALAKGVGQ